MKIEIQHVRSHDSVGVYHEWSLRIDGILVGTLFNPIDTTIVHAALILLEELAHGYGKSPLEVAEDVLKEQKIAEFPEKEKCPECGRPMQNLGNTAGVVYATDPPMWDETWVCHACKVRRTVHVRGAGSSLTPDLSGYREVK